MTKKGYKQTPEHIRNRYQNWHGPNHPNWLGDQATVKTGRSRAARRYAAIGPCAKCGALRSERHHKDGNTLNNEPSNIMVLCRRCHMEADGRLSRIRQVRAAVKRAGGRNALSAEQVREAINLRVQGWSQSRIGTHYGITQSAVSRILAGKRRRYQEMREGQSSE